MKIKTIQTFVITYEVPDLEVPRFMDALQDQEGYVLEEYEQNQEFIGEQRLPA